MSKVCLIIGAGASVPFGMPVGEKLKKKIIGNIQRDVSNINNSGDCNHHEYLPYEVKDLELFANTFLKTDIPSIDAFLENKPQFREMGKHYIAYSLLAEEKKSLEKAASSADWLTYVFTELDLYRTPERLADLQFISFNYDRLVEHYFLHQFSVIAGLDQAHQYLDSYLKIEHVHGDLGNYKQMFGKGSFFSSGGVASHPHAKDAAKSLKIVHDDSEIHYRDLVSSSETVAFLGLAPHEANLDKVWDKESDDSQTVYGTSYGLDANAKRRFKHYMLKEKLNEESNELVEIQEIELEDFTCLELLKNKPILPL